MAELTDEEHVVLQLASATYRYPEVRHTHVREKLDMSPTRFWQVVGALVERPEALEAYPVEVKRLQRLAALRRAQRRRSVA